MKKLSIIIPVYNNSQYLRPLLEKLLQQRGRKSIEVIAVDDGSTEDMSWIDGYKIKAIHKENGGCASARNAGLEASEGEFIAFLDADDSITDDYIETVYGDIKLNCDYVTYYWYMDDGKTIGFRFDDNPMMPNRNPWSYLFKRSMIGDTRFDETLNAEDDYDFLQRVIRPGLTRYDSEKALVIYNTNNPEALTKKLLRGEITKRKQPKQEALKTEPKAITKPVKVQKYKNVFWFPHIKAIGGIETFFWQIAQKYGDHDITIFYRTAEENQVKRLAKYVRVKEFTGERIRCEKAFFNYNTEIIDKVDADEYIQLVHGDLKALNIRANIHPKLDRYIAVSKHAAKAFEEISGVKCEYVYNPYTVPEPQKILKLISSTRMTPEKGIRRMKTLANALTEAGVKFIWFVFTDLPNEITDPNIIYMEPRMDITDIMAGADYLVQLSDGEAYCYSVIEALCVGTPVIVTPCPVYKEIGLNNKNSITLPFDMSEIPIEKITAGLPAFTYKPMADTWGDILVPGPSSYVEEMNTMVPVRCTARYFDLHFNRYFDVGDEYEVPMTRLDLLEKVQAVERRKDVEIR